MACCQPAVVHSTHVYVWAVYNSCQNSVANARPEVFLGGKAEILYSNFTFES